MPEDMYYLNDPVRVLISLWPMILLHLAAIIIVIIGFGRARGAALLALGALIFALVFQVGWPFFVSLLVQAAEEDVVSYEVVEFVLFRCGWVPGVVAALCWVLMAIAVISGRAPRPVVSPYATTPGSVAGAPAPAPVGGGYAAAGTAGSAPSAPGSVSPIGGAAPGSFTNAPAGAPVQSGGGFAAAGSTPVTPGVVSPIGGAAPAMGQGSAPPIGMGDGHVVRPMSKGFFFGSIIAAFVLMFVMIIPAMLLIAEGGRDEESIALVLSCASFIPVFYIAIAISVFIYRVWAALPPSHRRTSPGLAVGLCFVPLFNIYWIFQVYWGWTVDYNRCCRDRGLAAPRAPEGLALTLCILTLIAIIPFVGILASLINMVLIIVLFNAMINGVNALASASRA